MHKKLNLKQLLPAIGVLLFSSQAQASQTGIPGYSLSSTGSNSCHACHTPPTSAPANTLAITGNTTVLTSSFNAFTIKLSAPYTQTASHGGFNISSSHGTLATANGETLIANSELVHSNRKATTDTGSSYDVSWNFNWQAPATAGSSTFYACGLPVNGDGLATASGGGGGGGGPGPGGPHHGQTSSMDGFTACTSISIQVLQPPTANAGANQTVAEGSAGVTLDGSTSTDDGVMTYQWQQISGTPITLTNAGQSIATFDAPLVTTTSELIFRLTVTDNDGNTSTDTISVFVQDALDLNTPPIANAGNDQNVNENTLVTLDGTASSDNVAISNYLWEQVAGTFVMLDSYSIASPTFTAPPVSSAGELLTFQLTVTDGPGLQATSTVNVTVNDLDNPPVAKISDSSGTVITAIANNGQITLYGNFSNDPDGPISAYNWLQTAGPAILNPGITNTPQFTFTTPDSPGNSIDIQLTVTGDQGIVQNSITSTLTLNNLPPVVLAGVNQIYLEGETIYLDGLVSDPNNDITSILWQQINCVTSCITLPVNNQQSISFTLPPITPAESGLIMDFQLSATDATGLSSMATTSITIIDNGINSYPGDAISFYSNNSQPMAINLTSTDPLTNIEISVLQPISPDSITDTINRPSSFPYDLLNFEVILSNPGTVAEITLFFPEAAPEDLDFYQYINTNGWINNSGARDFDNLIFTTGGWAETSEQAYFNADRTQVTLQITDGGPSDADGLANGVINYTSGIGRKPAAAHQQAGASGSIHPLSAFVLLFILFITGRIHYSFTRS